MPRGHKHDPLYSFSIRNMVFHYIFLGKKAMIITFKHCTTIFFAVTILFQENFKKKARVNTKRIYRNVLMPPGHPIMLLKSNEFTMAAVSVKMSIHSFHSLEPYPSSERERKFRCHLCTSSVKREIRHFHVVIVQ